jgi:hypothetical protein
MQAPGDYRAQAADCLRRAEAAKSRAHQLILLQQAQTLLRMADDSEAIAALAASGDLASSHKPL